MYTIDAEVEKIYTVFQSMDMNYYESETEYCHAKRVTIDPFIFDSLKNLYSSYFKKEWNTNIIPTKSNKAIVIVERRCHPNLEFILHNVSYFAQGYTIHIFCSKANLEFIKTILGSQIENIHIYVRFEDVGKPEQGKTEYNNLLRDKTFWNLFEEEHILTIETDCYLLQRIPETIYEYDYVASKWFWDQSVPGGGGLSYRKCSVMKKICELDNPLVKDCLMQDSFVSNGIKLLDLKYSHEFFTESTLLKNPIGTHQWWTFFNTNLHNNIIKGVIRKYLTLIF